MRRALILLSCLAMGLAPLESRAQWVGAASAWQQHGVVTSGGGTTYTCTPPLLCAASTISLAAVPTDQGAGNVAIDFSNSNGAFVTNLTIDGTFTGALVGNASTATALAANPTDCSAGQYANAIATSGNLTCGGVTGAQVANTPAGTIAATDVQAALNELDTEKAAQASPAMTGTPTIGGAGITGAAEVLGAERVTNGSFTGAATGWTLNAGWAYGTNNVTHSSDGTAALRQTIATPTIGQSYKVTFTVSGLTVAGVRVLHGGAYSTTITADGTYSVWLYASSATSGNLDFYASVTGARFTLDDISCVPVTTGGGLSTTLPLAAQYVRLVGPGAGGATGFSGEVQLVSQGTSGSNLRLRDGAGQDAVNLYANSLFATLAGYFGTTGPTQIGEGYVRLRSTGALSWSASSGDASTGDTFASRSAAGVVSLGTTLGGTDAALLARNVRIPLVADATVQMGQVVMPDAGTDGRFDINTGIATTAIGVLAGTGASAAGTTYGIVTSGIAYVTPATGQTVTRQHFLCQSATAGVVDDSALLCTAGLGIGMALYSEAADVLVSATATTDVIVLTSAPGWAVNDPVVFYTAAGAAIAGMTTGNVYWIKTISSADVTLSATKGGATLDITANGTITTQYLQRLPQSVVHLQ